MMLQTIENRELRVEARFRNNVLWHAIHDTHASVAAFCRDFALDQVGVGRLLNLRGPAHDWRNGRAGRLTLQAKKLCKVTGLGEDELFPPALYVATFPKQLVNELPVENVPLLELLEAGEPYDWQQQNPEELFEQLEAKESLAAALATLPPREREAIVLYYGLGDEEPATAKQVGERLSGNPVCGERVRQMIVKGLRRLRHPSRTRALKAAVFGGGLPGF